MAVILLVFFKSFKCLMEWEELNNCKYLQIKTEFQTMNGWYWTVALLYMAYRDEGTFTSFCSCPEITNNFLTQIKTESSVKSSHCSSGLTLISSTKSSVRLCFSLGSTLISSTQSSVRSSSCSLKFLISSTQSSVFYTANLNSALL